MPQVDAFWAFAGGASSKALPGRLGGPRGPRHLSPLQRLEQVAVNIKNFRPRACQRQLQQVHQDPRHVVERSPRHRGGHVAIGLGDVSQGKFLGVELVVFDVATQHSVEKLVGPNFFEEDLVLVPPVLPGSDFVFGVDVG